MSNLYVTAAEQCRLRSWPTSLIENSGKFQWSMKRFVAGPSREASRWASPACDAPSVTLQRTCLPPREKSDDPCNIGNLPDSQYKSLTSLRCLPSTLESFCKLHYIIFTSSLGLIKHPFGSSWQLIKNIHIEVLTIPCRSIFEDFCDSCWL